MYEAFDPFEYIDFLRRRWRVIAIASAAALVLSLGVSLLIPKRYTATASIVIEPPGGSDLRTATAVSPVYLESLRTYERFAASDSLFARAVQRFHLQDGAAGQSIEGLKRQVLKVSKLRDTKILEISATLPSPQAAQSLVEYLANETVTLSRDESLAADRELVDDAGRRLEEAQRRLESARKLWTDNAAHESTAGLAAEIDADSEVLSKIRQELVAAEADSADYQEQEKTPFGQRQLQGARARVALLERRVAETERAIAEKSAALARQAANRDALQMNLKDAQTGSEMALARVRDLRAVAGTRGERLRVMDPGIVPQRPSSPNVPLNVIAALLLAATASLVYLSFAFAFRHRPPSKAESGLSRHASPR